MKSKIISVLVVAVALFSACDFLEAPPSTELDENAVFADRALAEQYITGIYAEGMPLGFSMKE